ncbi:PaaI family thioesterase [Acidovorax sp. CCYZU-2555]|uniref:PaaI family thioesterase n=1 Tax=Acidovorax sp. CCYZU-2555 TaxID=2835042 RepID=UPI001BCE7B05|nr:PaaI family thioesterase [Acidovorax sp. CCYZU-2555]MBS7781612.1 PaaI family thioesterase [Acidovorax sp. CCYZU-2555]
MQAPSFSAEAFAALPFMALLGVRREFSQGGRARLVVDMRPELLNPTDSMHGGVVATLVDVVMASAAVSRVDFRQTAVTLNLNTSYLQPGHGRLTADGEVLSVDDDGAVVQCQACVTDAQGRVVARSVGSFRYLDFRAPAGAPSL